MLSLCFFLQPTNVRASKGTRSNTNLLLLFILFGIKSPRVTRGRQSHCVGRVLWRPLDCQSPPLLTCPCKPLVLRGLIFESSFFTPEQIRRERPINQRIGDRTTLMRRRIERTSFRVKRCFVREPSA